MIEYLSVGATSAHPTDLGHLARSHTEASILFLDIAGKCDRTAEPGSAAASALQCGMVVIWESIANARFKLLI